MPTDSSICCARAPPSLEVLGADGAEVKIDGKPVGELRERDRLAVVAGAAGGFGAAVLATGLLLYVFDEPEVREPIRSECIGPEPSAPPPREPETMEISALPLLGPSIVGAGLQVRF
jgi:hypothetical protein